jgi:Leucine-rich repeat (LRR) protein
MEVPKGFVFDQPLEVLSTEPERIAPEEVSFAPTQNLLDQCVVQPFRVPQSFQVPNGPSFAASLATVAQSGFEILMASGLQLMMVPPLCPLHSLTTVHLSNNCLVGLPDEFAAALPNCQTLTLNQNDFKSFPSQVLQMRSLTSLNIQDNELRIIPSGISQLSGLTALFLGNCKLNSLPVSLGALTGLRVLHLQSNAFKSMPSSIGNFGMLQSLFLHDNRLASLPGNIGTMTSLAVLTLQNNQITSLPPSMQRLTSLWSLNISYNLLEDLPRMVRPLFFSGIFFI